MEHHSEAFVAFDTAKLRNAVAIADAGLNGDAPNNGHLLSGKVKEYSRADLRPAALH